MLANLQPTTYPGYAWSRRYAAHSGTGLTLLRGGEVSRSPAGQVGVFASLDRPIAEETATTAAARSQRSQELKGSSTNKGTVLELFHRADNPASINLTGKESNFQIRDTIIDAWEQGYDPIMFRDYISPGGKKGDLILAKDSS